MESRFQHIFLAVLATCALYAPNSLAGADPDALDLEPLVVREPDRRQVNVEALDQENFEIGGFYGLMNVEDFGTNSVKGLRAAYHVSEDFFVEGAYGMTTLGRTSFERLSGGAQLLTDAERDLTYYNLSVGYNILPGESFVSSRWAFKGGLYVLAGVGSTEFAGDDRFTINAGLGYRMAATDWLAFHVTVRDHIFDTDLLGESETKHNIEFSGGLTIFF